MTISVASLQDWITSHGFVDAGSQEANDLAVELLEAIRGDGAPRDTRNIREEFRPFTTEEIRADLRESRSSMVSIFVNVLGDFNLATGVRNANWFNTQDVRIVGRRQWDARGAVGTHHYTEVIRSAGIMDVIATLRNEGYCIVAAEIEDTAIPITSYKWSPKTAVIYGEEGAGLSKEVLINVDDVVFIPGRGSVRSLNVGTTSGIFMYEYSRSLGLI